MGLYVNPKNETKEAFLNRVGKKVDNFKEFKWEECPKDHLPVVLVQNPMFSAAGVAYCPKELDAFRDPNDIRHRELFLVPMQEIEKNTQPGLLKKYLEMA